MYQTTIYYILLLFSINKSQICPNQGRECNRPGECCSVHGYCGTGDAWCGIGNTMFPIDNTDDKDCPQCPICPGENRTLSPTPQPIEKPIFNHHCPCKCYGDPHCVMWNCQTNNYQGPHGVSPAGQFYYITPCEGKEYNHNNMPFDVIGVHKRYDNHFTSLDYTILKLYDDNGDIYCIKAKGNLGVTYNNDCSNNYNERINNGDIIILNNKFKLYVEYINGALYLKLNVLGNNCNDDDLILITTTPTIKEEGLELKMGNCYKKYTCGMCGNFYDTGLYFEKLDGSHITLSEGCWGGTANYDDGLSYLVPNTMGSNNRRWLQNILNDEEPNDEPCYGLLNNISTQCSIEINNYDECCNDRREFCDENIVSSCKWDACSCVMNFVEGEALGNSVNIINECVSETMSAAMNFTCILPADDFIIPQILVNEGENEENVIDEMECENNISVNIIIGIIIGFVIFIIIDIFIYFCCVKAAIDAVKNGYGVTNDRDNDEQQQQQQQP